MDLWVFCGSKNFSGAYFVGPKFFLMGILWVLIVFSWVVRGSKFFLVGISWVQNLSRGYLLGPNFFSCEYFAGQTFFLEVYFVIQRFSVAGCMSKSDKNRNTEIHFKPRFLF